MTTTPVSFSGLYVFDKQTSTCTAEYKYYPAKGENVSAQNLRKLECICSSDATNNLGLVDAFDHSNVRASVNVKRQLPVTNDVLAKNTHSLENLKSQLPLSKKELDAATFVALA